MAAADPEKGAGARGRLGPGVVVALAGALAVAILVGLVARLALADDEEAGGDSWHGTLIEQPRERPDLDLVDTDGNPFDFRAETGGKLTFLFFGFANCPDICPITLATLEGALSHVPRDLATVVFVTVDPERDQPEELRAYLDRFDSSFVGLTGSEAQISAAQDAAGVAQAQPEEPGEDGSYDVGHSSQVIVYTPDDLSHLVYGFGVRQDEWVADIERLREQNEWW